MSRLDSQELLNLAMEAANRDQHGDAVSYLKQALESDPDQAQIRFFLGAEYAQIGMFDRAVESMARAVELDPSLEIARFQLGLLHFTSGRPTEASQVWEAFNALPDGHPLYAFKTGLEALAVDDFDACRAWLTKGIEANKINMPLNADMQKVLDAIQGQKGAGDGGTVKPGEAGDAKTPETSGEHVFLNAYRGKTTH